jgi:hypothetical protein
MQKVGTLIRFDPKPFIDAANILMEADETERALALLENMPGYYRDVPPKEVADFKREIMAKIYTVQDYACNDGDSILRDIDLVSLAKALPRGKMLMDDISEANESGFAPHIVDYGPGDYVIPLGMHGMGLKFTYEPIGLHDASMQEAKKYLESRWETNAKRRSWFVAYEIIEHLHNPAEIRQQFDRIETCERVYMSTPLYTFARGNPLWREKKCGHLRTYTPDEFVGYAKKYFREFNWELYPQEIMILRGKKA